MNIDIREYLRINPISVHELTLSDKDNDCFLLFPANNAGYQALMQNVLFSELQKSILGGLLGSDGKIKTSDATEDDIDGKFSNYVRRSEVQDFMTIFDQRLATLESELDNIILTLRRKGILDYAGAVELQSINTRKISWTSSDGKINGPLYKNMSYATGHIWCKSTDSSIPTTGGSDEVSIGNLPLSHNHPQTMAEALTGSLACNFGGGQTVGDMTIGVKEFISQGDKDHAFGPTIGNRSTPLAHSVNEPLTYPLWGQNVLDWRNPKKTHSNMPPSLNIFVRFWNEAQGSIRGIMASEEDCVEMLKRLADIQEKKSSAEAQYQSSMVMELPQYHEDNLSPHDYLLRILSNGENDIQLMRQGIQMLLDIFATKTNEALSTANDTMKELLMQHLDGLLFTLAEFLRWHHEKLSKLEELERKIQTVKELIVSVPPLNYIGRTIISFTDDTEQKVIAKYGGKRWRRIENFLRGNLYDPSTSGNEELDMPGRKMGEDYVTLRESNIPIHSHSETLDQPTESQVMQWMAKNKQSSNTKIVNATSMVEDSPKTVEISSVDRNYQISPLEYPSKEQNNITLPHDNLPPYMKMYIWECTELSDEEREITGEPKDNKCVITWLYNGGKVGQSSSTTQQRTIGGNHSSVPSPTYANHDFIGWKDMSGQIKTEDEIVNLPVSGNETYVAQWKPKTYLVTFDGNGGEPQTMSRKYKYGELIGYLPTMDKFPEGKTNMLGWSPLGGRKITETDVVTNNMELFARWSDGRVNTITRKQDYNTVITAPPIEARTGYDVIGWDPQITSATKMPAQDMTYRVKWQAKQFTMTFDANGGTGGWSRSIDCGSSIEAPTVTKTGATFLRWEPAVPATMPAVNLTCVAQWTANQYTMIFDAGNGAEGGTSITAPMGTPITPPDVWKPGYVFKGWQPTPPATMPYGGGTYRAIWDINYITITFDSNGGS